MGRAAPSPRSDGRDAADAEPLVFGRRLVSKHSISPLLLPPLFPDQSLMGLTRGLRVSGFVTPGPASTLVSKGVCIRVQTFGRMDGTSTSHPV